MRPPPPQAQAPPPLGRAANPRALLSNVEAEWKLGGGSVDSPGFPQAGQSGNGSGFARVDPQAESSAPPGFAPPQKTCHVFCRESTLEYMVLEYLS